LRLYVDILTVDGISVYAGDGAPAFTATRGSIYSDRLTGDLWRNTSAGGIGTTWVSLGSGGSSSLTFGNGQVGTSTTPRYLEPGFNPELAPISETAEVVEFACIVDRLYVRHNDVGAAAEPIVYTLMIDGVATTLTCTVNANASGGSDLTHAVVVPAGSRASIRATKAGVLTASPTRIVASVRVTAT